MFTFMDISKAVILLQEHLSDCLSTDIKGQRNQKEFSQFCVKTLCIGRE